MNLANKLKEIIPSDRVSTNETILLNHSRDDSFHPARFTDVVIFPEEKEDIIEIIKFANINNIAVTPFGIGSGLEGSAIPVNGGISLDLKKMNKILEINPEDFLVQVQPGVTRVQLNKELGKYGLFFSVDPGADATLGGMASTNASGTTTVRYGMMKDNVRDLEVVLADGRVIRTGGNAKKSSSGYNLTELFVGSEGTLGIFTELTLQVYGIPEVITAARAVFPTTNEAIHAAQSLLTVGVPIARLEFVEGKTLKYLNHVGNTNYIEDTSLFIEFHGSKGSVIADVELTKKLFNQNGCYQLHFETNSSGRNRLWEARHNSLYALIHQNPGKQVMNTDVCVPLSKLAEVVEFTRKCKEESGLQGDIIGHIGDGNLHAGILIDTKPSFDMEKANQFNEAIVKFALLCSGTCTGEHGVGLGKKKYQSLQHGVALDVMKSIKNVLDPNNILNPGKIFDTTEILEEKTKNVLDQCPAGAEAE
ncbi:D-lactate dehydrogenase (cytochrome) [Evansella vedderi]|uniref:D-lactate dehydrogenase (cytochrome) n=1 Tax=Evansella vedderi TaxID=38282 RepID=A0ABT9ZQB9_9BACI|nr:FAD-binding oxidoreductase [Evansella vedderi]MDQ0252926.1 D-lactate dehydrogenase (cytochrome) [Evansella vedderi]